MSCVADAMGQCRLIQRHRPAKSGGDEPFRETELAALLLQSQTSATKSAQSGHPETSAVCPLSGGGFNRSAQHLLILRGEEVCHGDVADLVHGSAEGRAVGAMEEWAKC